VTDDDAREAEDPEHKRDRQMIELLNELRVAIVGVQVLFGFLLTVPFAQGFGEVTGFERRLYLVALLSAAGSTACLIAPAAAHRLRFHQRDRSYLIETANSLVIAGMVLLAIAITAVVVLVCGYLFGAVEAIVYGVGTAGVVGGLWFVRPLLRGHNRRGGSA
jgi:hypothetical protein